MAPTFVEGVHFAHEKTRRSGFFRELPVGLELVADTHCSSGSRRFVIHVADVLVAVL